ncbi:MULTISPECIES: LysR family transcriptional regulator [Halomonadaceae]|uniref:LysR family transcriptional regulator n=1 Tax=Halomonas cibimaris TaxID=657012 RepID=A0ABP7L9R3_9GAMM|nr:MULTISPECIES: LysR family transcriptional regulator [Halomonas]
MINPQWLRTFTTLVELGNFTRTAERLDLTQAAVSQHIKRLEGEVGALFIRHPRRLELTPSGHALCEYSREVGVANHRLHQRLTDDDGQQGEVSLITPGSIGLALYPHLLEIQRTTPGLSIYHRFAPTQEIVAGVLENRFELGIVTLPQDDPRLAVSVFAREALELVVPAHAKADEWADLARLGFIDHPDGHEMATRLLSRRFPGFSGVCSLPNHGFTNQVGLILEPVALGLGFTVLPRFARQAFSRPEAIRVVTGEPAVVDTLWLLHRAEWPLSARAERMLNAIKPVLGSAH